MSKNRFFSYILIILGLIAYFNYESKSSNGEFKKSKRTIATENNQALPLTKPSLMEENQKTLVDQNKESLTVEQETQTPTLIESISNTEEVSKIEEFNPQEALYKSRIVFGIPKGPAACLSDYDVNGCFLHAYHCVEVIRDRIDLDEASDLVPPERLMSHAIENLKKEYYYADLTTDINYQRSLEIIQNEKAPYWKARYEEYMLKELVKTADRSQF